MISTPVFAVGYPGWIAEMNDSVDRWVHCNRQSANHVKEFFAPPPTLALRMSPPHRLVHGARHTPVRLPSPSG